MLTFTRTKQTMEIQLIGKGKVAEISLVPDGALELTAEKGYEEYEEEIRAILKEIGDSALPITQEPVVKKKEGTRIIQDRVAYVKPVDENYMQALAHELSHYTAPSGRTYVGVTRRHGHPTP